MKIYAQILVHLILCYLTLETKPSAQRKPTNQHMHESICGEIFANKGDIN